MDLHRILRSGRELSQDYEQQTRFRATRYESSPPSSSHSPFFQPLPRAMHRFPTSSSFSSGRRRSSSSYYFSPRKPRAFWSEQEQILIMRWCLGHRNYFADKNYTKREFWNACTRWMQHKFGRFIVRPDKSIQTWEARRRKEMEMERGTGVALPKTEWRQVMDEWLEFLESVKTDAVECGHNAEIAEATLSGAATVVDQAQNQAADAMGERRILEEQDLVRPLERASCDSEDIQSPRGSRTVPAGPASTQISTEINNAPSNTKGDNKHSQERPEIDRGPERWRIPAESRSHMPEEWPVRIDVDADGAKWFALSYIIRNVEMLRDEVEEIAKMQKQLAAMMGQKVESNNNR